MLQIWENRSNIKNNILFQVMWQFFTKVIPEDIENYSRPALTLLGMVATSEPR